MRHLTVSPSRHCSQCRTMRPKDGGGWKRISGLRQRWLCQTCLARQKAA
jgi:hypothetical protein